VYTCQTRKPGRSHAYFPKGGGECSVGAIGNGSVDQANGRPTIPSNRKRPRQTLTPPSFAKERKCSGRQEGSYVRKGDVGFFEEFGARSSKKIRQMGMEGNCVAAATTRASQVCKERRGDHSNRVFLGDISSHTGKTRAPGAVRKENRPKIKERREPVSPPARRLKGKIFFPRGEIGSIDSGNNRGSGLGRRKKRYPQRERTTLQRRRGGV